MEEFNLLKRLGQVSAGEAAEVFREHLRGAVLGMMTDVMAMEVEELCGPFQMHDSSFANCAFMNVDFGQAVLYRTSLSNCLFENCSFVKASIQKVNFVNCIFDNVNFHRCHGWGF